jgi:hypothetical protein
MSVKDLLVVLYNFKPIVDRQYAKIDNWIEAGHATLLSLYEYLVFQTSSRAMQPNSLASSVFSESNLSKSFHLSDSDCLVEACRHRIIHCI